MRTSSATQTISGRGAIAVRVYPGAKPVEGYTLVRYLGRGGFGEVWEAEAPGGLSKAIKLAPMENTDAALNCRELEGLKKVRSIRHPYLLSIERFEIIDGYLGIVMELADKSLADRFDECVAQGLPGIPRDELLRYMREASEVLDLMNHQHGLQHLDVKPENLFLLSGHIKVADFGLVQSGNTNLSRSAVAISPPYAPPELFDGRIESTADQYSLAVTYQELLTGVRPFSGTDVRELIMQHLAGRPHLSALPPSDRTAVARALQREVGKRFGSCTEFVDALHRAAAFGAPLAAREQDMRGSSPAAEASAPPKPSSSASQSPRAHGLAQKQPGPRAKKSDSRTVSLARRAARTEPVERATNTSVHYDDDFVRETFVAFLPLEIFAHKLRGFIDSLGAEIVKCTDDSTVLAFRSRGWFGIRSSKGVFLQLDTYARSASSGYRAVDVSVWCTGKRWRGQDLVRRGILLIRCLKEFLMATDSGDRRLLKSSEQVRADLLG